MDEEGTPSNNHYVVKRVQVHGQVQGKVEQDYPHERLFSGRPKPQQRNDTQLVPYRRTSQKLQRPCVSKHPLRIEPAPIQGIVVYHLVQSETFNPRPAAPLEPSSGEIDQAHLDLYESKWPHRP